MLASSGGGVDAHADTNRTPLERPLCLRRRRQRVLRAPKRHEEGIALRVHLDTAVRSEHLPQQAPMLREHLSVLVAELVQQPGGTLNIREQERDRAGRLAH